ncbi:MAG: ABC transporter substrate-binding protein [Cyanobium sp.]
MAAPPAPKPSRRPLWALGVISGVIAAAALGLWQISRQGGELVVAITNWPAYEYFYLAENKDLARPFGLNLRVAQYSSLFDQRQAYERGDAQAIATTLSEAIAICQEMPARCPLLILVLDQSLGADRILAHAPISTPQQLLGKRVGLENAVLAEYMLMRSLGDRPRPLGREMRLRYDVPEALVQKFKAGELDAFVTYHPYDTGLEGDPTIREVFSSRRIPGEIVDVLAVDPAYAAKHPDDLRALLRTWWATRRYARQNPIQASTVMGQRQQLTPSQFQASERGLHYPSVAEQAPLLAPDGPLSRTLRRMSDLMRTSGRIQPNTPQPSLSRDFLVTP